MPTALDDLEKLAMQPPARERSELAHRLIVRIDCEPEGAPEEITRAWDEEIACRVADMEAGLSRWTPADEVMVRLRVKLAAARADAGQS